MPYSLWMIVILTAVLNGPSLAEDKEDEITDVDLQFLHSALQAINCASSASEKELERFDLCYNINRQDEDHKGCKEKKHDTYQPCINMLDQKKVDTSLSGLLEACKNNGNSTKEVKTMNKFSRCILGIRIKLCENSTIREEYNKALHHALRSWECVDGDQF